MFLKFKPIFVLIIVVTLVISCSENNSNQADAGLFAVGEPLESGYLKVSELHELYYEVHGNKDGIPVIALHGGPGGIATTAMAGFFDQKLFKVVLFDQRGAIRSRPPAEWKDNTTQLLIEDINKIRDHVGVTGKALLFGGSWGTTLALAYAEAYPDLVRGLLLRGVFLGTRSEMDFLYQGGMSRFFPEVVEEYRSIIPDPESGDYPRQIFEMTQSSNPETRKKAIDGFARFEFMISSLTMTREECDYIIDNYDLTPLSVLENFYAMNSFFLEEGQLLRNIETITSIPAYIVNGRFDFVCPAKSAVELSAKLENVKLVLASAGHSQSEPEIQRSLLAGVKWLTAQLK